MFRKLVSNLPYSPALVGQLGFYAQRLKKEEVTRRLGLLITVLALILQSFAVFSPPEAANASNPSDMIHGGISTKQQLLAAYDSSARGNGDLKQIFDYAGITREELAATQDGTINSKEKGTGADTWLTWGRQHRFSASEGEVKHTIGSSTLYSRPLWRYNNSGYAKKYGSTHRALVGYSQAIGEFAVLKDCGNLMTTKLPTPPPPPPPVAPKAETRCSLLTIERISRTSYRLVAKATTTGEATISSYRFVVKDSSGSTIYDQVRQSTDTSIHDDVSITTEGDYNTSVEVTTSEGVRGGESCKASLRVAAADKCLVNGSLSNEDPECQPCPLDPSLWHKDPDCSPQIASDKSALNLTRGKTDAATQVAQPGDRIEYTVSVHNTGKVPATTSLDEELADVMEYATIQDNGGGSFNQESAVLSWGDISLNPGESQQRSFTVAILPEIPSTARGVSEPSSYDCVITNAFGKTIDIPVACSSEKLVEQISAELPRTGPTENIIFAGAVGSIVTYFYARSRQLKKEVRLIRHEFNAGTL